MSEKQPEALQLAALFEVNASFLDVAPDDYFWKTAAELRRQHALLEEMAVAMRWVKLIFSDDTFAQERDPELWLPEFDAVLAKWEASK